MIKTLEHEPITVIEPRKEARWMVRFSGCEPMFFTNQYSAQRWCAKLAIKRLTHHLTYEQLQPYAWHWKMRNYKFLIDLYLKWSNRPVNLESCRIEEIEVIE